MTGKKIRTKPGDIFKIPIDESNISFGQVIVNSNGVLRIVTFDRLYSINDTPTTVQILNDKIVLLTDTQDAKIYHGDWVIYSNESPMKDLPRPSFKYGQDTIYITNYEGTKSRVATSDENNLLDFKFSVAPIRIQNAMQAFFGLRPWDNDFNKLTIGYCVEKSKIKL